MTPAMRARRLALESARALGAQVTAGLVRELERDIREGRSHPVGRISKSRSIHLVRGHPVVYGGPCRTILLFLSEAELDALLPLASSPAST